jgi:hypothetical protein
MRRSLITAIGVVALLTAATIPAFAAPRETHHITDHRASAEFNNAAGRGTVQIYATWYSPQSTSGDIWFTPESNLYVTYWGDKIGDDCTISGRIDDWDMKWSQNHAYVAFESECGFFELYVKGSGGVEPDHDWNHSNSYWYGQHGVRNSQWNDAGTTAELYIDGQLVDLRLNGAGLSRTSSSIRR